MSEAEDAKRAIPFPGVEPYMPEDANVFFGREDLSEDVAHRLLAHRPVFLHGPSGAGKSSLLFAGVVPLIPKTLAHFRDDTTVIIVAIREWTLEAPYFRAKFAIAHPGTKLGPFRNLEVPPTSLKECLRIVLEALPFSGEPQGDYIKLFFVLDQLEDLWPEDQPSRRAQLAPISEEIGQLLAYLRWGGSAGAPPIPASASADGKSGWHLPEAVQVHIIVGIREDCLHLLEYLNRDAAIDFDSLVRVNLLRRDEAVRAIRKPLASAGFEIDPDLTDRIVADLSGWSIQRAASQPMDTALSDSSSEVTEPPTNAPGQIEPILLQIVMARLSKHALLSPDKSIKGGAYDLAGGVKGISTEHFAEALRSLGEGQNQMVADRYKMIADRCFLNLVTAQGRKVPMSTQELSALVSQAIEVDYGEVSTVLGHLANRRILRKLSFSPPRSEAYELFHDVFAAVARVRAEGRIHRDREIAAMDRKRQRTRSQIAGVAVLVALTLAIGSIWWSRSTVQRANQELDAANLDLRNKQAALIDADLLRARAEADRQKTKRESAIYFALNELPPESEYQTTQDPKAKRKFERAPRLKALKSIKDFVDRAKRFAGEDLVQITADDPGPFRVEVERHNERLCRYSLVFHQDVDGNRDAKGISDHATMVSFAWDNQGYLRTPIFTSFLSKGREELVDREFIGRTCFKNAFAIVQGADGSGTIETKLYAIDACALAAQTVLTDKNAKDCDVTGM